MRFKPIKTKKIYEEIIDQVKNMIKEGDLNPGDKLIAERELAEKLEVGRSAVREAFRVMEAMGIIKIKPGEGTYISEVNADSLVNTIAPADVADTKTSREIMELRKILEVQAAEIAAERCAPEQLKVIGDAVVKMEQDMNEGYLGEEADMKFHYSITEATCNSLLIKLMNSISDTMTRVLAAARHELYQDPNKPSQLLEEHRAIYAAIKDKDPAAARRAMLEHLVGVEDFIFRYDKKLRYRP
ncbi:MAG: FadR family transcriptional regulator [Clostridiales bacterium]|nr:FadR family transcriptional regulator [Clostridiales bacterium]MCF8023696.1 FadR family transcriptional regulator [Clostridiales bacterium]